MELFRPLPLFVWATLLHLGSGPSIIHLLNVILHGTNSYLTARLVSGWVEDRRWALLAGLVMLTAPLAPEAVAWSSGVFDLMATFFVLTAICDRANLHKRHAGADAIPIVRRGCPRASI
jgi:hypothetical protein